MSLPAHNIHFDGTDRCPACEQLWNMPKKYQLNLNRDFNDLNELGDIFAEIIVELSAHQKNDPIADNLDDIVGLGWSIEKN